WWPTVLASQEGDDPSVRVLILGGEACPPQLVARWSRPGRRVVNTYGPTEATVIATYADCAAGRPITIGRPLPNYACYILNQELQPVPPGEAGEIYLAGIGLARGYVRLPEQAAARVVPNPYASGDAASARLYRQGQPGR